ncbi:MAG: tripeptide aminopeptidase PepT, partial [Firmicutes bacterium]|nr:tripeptide aminopeptidase PepT [Bacillota bacterium]
MDILQRFLNYVAFYTDSDGSSDAIPTTPGQTLLLNLLEEEMAQLGLENIHRSPSGQLYGFLAATDDSMPNIGFIAHVDTVPNGKDVKPQIIHYEGGDIVHENGAVTPVAIFDFLEDYKGQDLIITDGNTVLGADDKAGIAEIMTAVEYLKAHPELPHGRIGVAFTPDEEIGRSSRGFDIEGFGMDFAYTLDGSTLGKVECENFNGASVRVRFNGISVHPGASKNKMKSAILICNEFINMLPAGEDP